VSKGKACVEGEMRVLKEAYVRVDGEVRVLKEAYVPCMLKGMLKGVCVLKAREERRGEIGTEAMEKVNHRTRR